MLEQLQKYYDEEGYNVEVMEEIKFNDFSVLRCKEWHPVTPSFTCFDIIAKDGKFYNDNFDDIVELNYEMKYC